MKVHNMKSTRTGKAIPNQFVIMNGNTIYFQSYETIVCMVDNDHVFIDSGESCEYGDEFSRTTVKYLLQFLRQYSQFDFQSLREVEKAIEYNPLVDLTNLNA